MGRLVKDPELKKTNSDLAFVKFTVAVNRPFQKNGEKQADFVNCVAWRKTAEVISQYFAKGHRILLEGSIQTGSYDDKNGTKHYTTDVLVDKVHFIESKSSTQNKEYGNYNNQSYEKPQNQMPSQSNNHDEDVSPSDFDVSSDDLPF
jgi:single-strand DNA-binding protein